LRVLENRVLPITSGPKREEVTEGLRMLNKDHLRNKYTSLNIIRVIKSSRIRLTGRVTRMAEMRNAYNILVVNLKGGGH
jgi:hypothetical protein